MGSVFLKTKKRWGTALGMVILVGVMAFTIVIIITDDLREGAVANLKKPAVVVRQEQLLEQIRRRSTGNPSEDSPTTLAPESSEESFVDIEDTIAAYDRLFERIETALNSADVPDNLRRRNWLW